jgi:hypothetical protein
MAEAGAAGELLRFLERRLFAPVLSVDPEAVEAGERAAFDELQEQLRRVAERLTACPTPEALLGEFDEYWHSDMAVAARHGLARLGHPVDLKVWREFRDLARRLGVSPHPEGWAVLAGDPELEARIRVRARELWEADGKPPAGAAAYLERARDLEAIAENPDAGQEPNPEAEPQTILDQPPGEEPVEPPEAVENQADVPGRLTDQGDRPSAPMRQTRKRPEPQ